MDTLGKRIKFARDYRKLTQVSLAFNSGLKQGDISKLENGSMASTTKVVQLAKALDCDPYWLATGEGEPWGQTASHDLEFDGRGGNVVGIEVVGASEFAPDGVDIDQDDPSTKGVVLGSGVHHGYAIKVVGDRNAPALKDGQFVVVEVGGIREGEMILFHMESGEVLLRELLRETDDSYHVDGVAWGSRQTLRKALVRRTEPVVAVVSATRWRPTE